MRSFFWLALLVAAVVAGDRKAKTFLLPETARFHLRPLLQAFDALGITEYNGEDADSWHAAKYTDDVDLIWSYEYVQLGAIGPLTRRHKVNHLPGSFVLVSKGHVYETQQRLQAEHGKFDFNFIPAQYRLPQDVDEFSAAFRARRDDSHLATKPNDPLYNRRWLLKSQAHRGVRFFSGMEELGEHMHTNDMVAQCIEPLLISGHKFDIGLYVAVTSIDPLRIYMCKLPYPVSLDNAADLESYVVDEYLPPWEMPALRDFYTELPSKTREGTSHFAVLKKHLDAIGLDADKFEREIYGDVIKIIAGNRAHFIDAERTYRRQHRQTQDNIGSNFFEMYRFDFMVEDNGKPWLMEVNQSPNLAPKFFDSGTDAAMKDGIVHDLLHMVGVQSPTDKRSPPQLDAASCADRCKDKASQLWDMGCWSCDQWLSKREAQTLFEAATEHARRGKFNLVYPADKTYDSFVSGGLSADDNTFAAYLTSFATHAANEPSQVLDALLCSRRVDCSKHGDCVNGACVCDVGYEGKTCYISTGRKQREEAAARKAKKEAEQADEEAARPKAPAGVLLQPGNLREAQDAPMYPRSMIVFLFCAVLTLTGAFAYANRKYLQKSLTKSS
ncbi:hypothetical protein SPRG_02452 [Saprolegnia parasitica CBS 223.65]|uniref:Tubulin--tyrosine ligase-like protein 5 n=1 Tax=Saprolegnia parasitica (strain CBS 223.65) TaxID=695850 RepID=A0A067CQ05_SAPPC|nr:hypothetical protein SPRG_02452 [Saprolegnia parasitica CBS 223.65]KDO32754.1 hypothetical protein SPRG_02452 [Saprolegnia parasitica CBS 223.65]|eukprot:XP_012196418.1 hypothetical protein SPRG_02452 [Saprolegnia parasitica CBS 223.65]